MSQNQANPLQSAIYLLLLAFYRDEDFSLQDNAVIRVLKRRTSCAQLVAPGPSTEQLRALLDVACRAADHRQLRPWRFLVVQDSGLDELGKVFLNAQQQSGKLKEEQRLKALRMPRRAPMIIVIIACITADPKVPDEEQLLSAGAATQNMLNGAFAMGLGAIWRTGALASHPYVHSELGLRANEKIVAFLYLGTAKQGLKAAPAPEIQNLVKTWP